MTNVFDLTRDMFLNHRRVDLLTNLQIYGASFVNVFGFSPYNSVISFRRSYSLITINQNGKDRIIDVPTDPVKAAAQKMLKILKTKLVTHPCSLDTTGIKANATPHLNAKHLLKIDISNFYQTTRASGILEKINRNDSELHQAMYYAQPIWAINRRTKVRNSTRQPGLGGLYLFLPTGSPLSPFLANFYLYDLDEKINQFVISKGGIYTRYLDDFTISFQEEQSNETLNKTKSYIEGLISSMGYTVHPYKSKWTNFKHDKIIIAGVDIRTGKTRLNNSDFKKTWRPKLNEDVCYIPTLCYTSELIIRPKILKKIEDNKSDWWLPLFLTAESLGYFSYLSSISQEQHDEVLGYVAHRIQVNFLKRNIDIEWKDYVYDKNITLLDNLKILYRQKAKQTNDDSRFEFTSSSSG